MDCIGGFEPHSGVSAVETRPAAHGGCLQPHPSLLSNDGEMTKRIPIQWALNPRPSDVAGSEVVAFIFAPVCQSGRLGSICNRDLPWVRIPMLAPIFGCLTKDSISLNTIVREIGMKSTQRNGMSYSDAGKLGAEVSTLKAHKQKEIRVDAYNQSPKRCKHCGLPIPYDKRFNTYCSSSCSASHTNVTAKRKPRKVFVCENCGKEIHSMRKVRFCNLKCSSEFFSKKAYNELLDYIGTTGEFPCGNGKTTSGEVNRYMVKRYLEKKNGHKCSICGNEEWMGKPIPLIVDHIDGNPTNSKVDNFRLVCGNCNMQLDTFAGKNRGHGRAWRKRYYQKPD